jgi:(p)ppGpp synthase/HD superfamily hydrolase
MLHLKTIKSIFGKEITELLLNFHKFVQFDSRLFRKSSLETFFIDYFIDANIECESSLLKKDKRILLIRLCDCIDNTKNLKYLKKQPHIDWLLHTNLNFRVPLAIKMGINKPAEELEKLSTLIRKFGAVFYAAAFKV